MSRTVTLRLNEDVYSKFRSFANSANKSLSSFIETSILRYIQEHEFADDAEMAEIDNNEQLQASLKRAFKDAKARRGNFV